MSIQGAGISTQIAFTHRHYRAQQKRTRELLDTLRHRNQMCIKYGITSAEYMKRLNRWQELRQVVATIKARFQRRDDVEEVETWMMEKKRFRLQNAKQQADERAKQKAKDDFSAFMRPPVE